MRMDSHTLNGAQRLKYNHWKQDKNKKLMERMKELYKLPVLDNKMEAHTAKIM